MEIDALSSCERMQQISSRYERLDINANGIAEVVSCSVRDKELNGAYSSFRHD